MNPRQTEDCCVKQQEPIMTQKEYAQQRLESQLGEIEKVRKLIKFFDKFPDAAKYLEENQLWVHV